MCCNIPEEFNLQHHYCENVKFALRSLVGLPLYVMTSLSLISPINIQKKKKKIRNINLEIHQFSCEVTTCINTLKNCGIYTAVLECWVF